MSLSVSSRKTASVAVVLLLVLASTVSAQITVGNLVVARVGDGSVALTGTASPTFLDEMTTGGAAVQTLPMPTAVSGGNLRLVNSGSATSEAFLTQSVDGRYLTLGGYDAAPGTLTIASTPTTGATPVVRVIGRVDVGTGTIDTSTSTTAYSAGNIRSVSTLDGTDFYATGSNSGVHHCPTLGGTSSTQLSGTPTNVRVVQPVVGQLYVTSASGAFLGLATVGTGLPTTSGQTTTMLTGMGASGTGNPSNYDYWFADQSTVYIADDRTAVSGGGIQKWTLSGGTWSLAYILAVHTVSGARSVTGEVVGGTPVLYAVTSASALNQIVTITDTGAGSAATPIATAAVNTIFRGLRLVKPVTSVTAFGAGCSGTGGLTPALAVNNAAPVTRVPFFGNNLFSLSVSQAVAGGPVYLYGSIGTNPGGTIVAGSCVAYLDVPSALSLISGGIFPISGGAADGSGNATIAVPIPYAPFLAGTHVALQVLIFDAGSGTGFTLTNALDMLLNG
jgi:hypothetical protein